MKKRDKDRLRLWQDRLRRANAAYEPELSKMDGREELYQGCNRIRPIVCTARKRETPHVRNLCAELVESQVDSNIPQPKVTPRRREDEWRAKLIEDMLRNELDRLPFEQMNDIMERTIPIQGGGAFLVEWDNSKAGSATVGELAVSTLHPKQIIPQDGVYTGVEDMDYIILKIPQTKGYIRRTYGVDVSEEAEEEPDVKGSGGEGKSQIGAVLGTLFGSNMKDGSIGKISENRFARADLEHILLCVDDDMRMEALRQTNYVKSIVTAQGKMDLERKGKQSYQGWMCARLLAFSNGDLQALFDRSDGFYRRQLVLTTKEKPAGRVDDPDLAEKMKAEVEGILLWAFEGLQRLAANNFKFPESDRTRENREAVKRDNNNVYDFLDSDGYVRLKADLSASSKELYEAYQIYCTENNLPALKPRSFSEALIACQSRYNLEYCNNVTNAAGRRVRGFLGIEVLVRNHISVFSGDSMRTYVPENVPEEWRR